MNATLHGSNLALWRFGLVLQKSNLNINNLFFLKNIAGIWFEDAVVLFPTTEIRFLLENDNANTSEM